MADERINRLAAALAGQDRPGPTNALAQGIGRMLSPEDERGYQTFMAFDPSVRQWRNAFSNTYGGPPQTEGGDYDYRAAYMAGNRPQPVPNDTVPHWGSTGKAEGHPTAWKQAFMMQFGIDPDTPGMRYSTDMQQFIQRQLQQEPTWGMLAPKPGAY